MTVFEFFAKHECTQHEKRLLLVKLAELRYAATLALLQKVMR